jgi:hypothetical protein
MYVCKMQATKFLMFLLFKSPKYMDSVSNVPPKRPLPHRAEGRHHTSAPSNQTSDVACGKRKKCESPPAKESSSNRQIDVDGFQRRLPAPFNAIGRNMMDKLNLLALEEPMPPIDLPKTLHPLFRWFRTRWNGFQRGTHTNILPALWLASHLIRNNREAKHFFTRVWFAKTTAKCVRSHTNCPSSVFLGPIASIGNIDRRAVKRRMAQMAPYVSFDLGFSTTIKNARPDGGITEESDTVRSSYGMSGNECISKVPKSQQVSWLDHRHGCRVRIGLSEDLLSFATS